MILFQVFGLTLSYLNTKSLTVLNTREPHNSRFNCTTSKLWKYRMLLKPIITALVMLNQPISEGFTQLLIS